MLFKYAFSSQNELTKDDFSALDILNPELKSAHPKRQASFLAARKALQKLVPYTKLEELHLNEFHFLQAYPEKIFSLAHTQDHAMAVMVDKSNYRSVGADMEFADRALQAGSDRHFLNSLDDQSLTKLELWCAKEACFKAISFLYDKNFVLKDLWLKNNSFGHVSDISQSLGEYKLIRQEKLILAFAIVFL